MEPSAFLRLFQLRAAEIMWFLGSGASRAAGIKTAADMILDFKQRLYRSTKKLPPSAITDIGDPIVQRKLQAYFDGLGTFPPQGAENEYSAYFEATYPAQKDRRSYLDQLIAKGKPSFGHLALLLLVREKLCRAIWTPNFDRNVEDAAATVLGGTGHLVVADLAEPDKLRLAWAEQRWPVLGKLHGDYHSQQLKNTDDELRQQDGGMRRCLIDGCRHQGLAVIGYSGRDTSIIESLTEALDAGRGFPSGLFWFKRSQDEPYPAVMQLIATARQLGVDAHFVEAESFDELFSDLIRFLPQTADKVQLLTTAARPRLAASALKKSNADIPAIRTNALPIISHPAVCRLVDCTIGGYAEVHAAIAAAGVDIDAFRCPDGVIAFGRDADIRRAFERYGIKKFEPHPIASRRLHTETGERGLVRDGLFRAVGKRPGLRLERKGHRSLLLPDPVVVQPATFNTEKSKPVDRVAGIIAGTPISWSEACGLRLDYRLDHLWLLLEPRVVLELPEGTPDAQVELSREFVRERRARRHNRLANAMLDGWIALIVGSTTRLRLRAFDIADGIDAEYEIMRVSGFSGVAR